MHTRRSDHIVCGLNLERTGGPCAQAFEEMKDPVNLHMRMIVGGKAGALVHEAHGCKLLFSLAASPRTGTPGRSPKWILTQWRRSWTHRSGSPPRPHREPVTCWL